MVLGISPPMPMPVQKRSTMVTEYPCAQISASVVTPYMTLLSRMATLRP